MTGSTTICPACGKRHKPAPSRARNYQHKCNVCIREGMQTLHLEREGERSWCGRSDVTLTDNEAEAGCRRCLDLKRRAA